MERGGGRLLLKGHRGTTENGVTDKMGRHTSLRGRVPSLHIRKLHGTDGDEPPARLQPQFRPATQNRLPPSGPVALFGHGQVLPTTVADRSQVMRFSLREDGGPGAWLTNEIFDRGIDTDLTLCFGCPAQGDEQGPLTDEGVKSLVGWIGRWVPLLPDVPIKLDLSGNQITARSLRSLAECLKRHPRIQGLDLCRNQGLTGLLPAKPKTARRAIGKTWTSPRSTQRKKQQLTAGEAIRQLLATTSLQEFRVSDNPFSPADRALILQAAAASPTLCKFDMSNCALSAAEVEVLIGEVPGKKWRHLGLGTNLKQAMVNFIANHLLPATPTLVSLDLGTTEPYSSLDVIPVLRALENHPCLKTLSLAGHGLRGDAKMLTEALRLNKVLRTLDLSRCTMDCAFFEALTNSLKWGAARDEASKPNHALTRLILTTFDDPLFPRDQQESLARMCAIAIDRNRHLTLRAHAAEAFHAGLWSSPWKGLPLPLCSLIVEQLGDDKTSVRNLATVVPARGARTAGWRVGKPG